ncbi:uncharacterized protein LOC111870627 [Cryptotermes secundus]|uniref:uncharacterized protein LOC111870627 n=1 Tax=Cryptotermes secundus TaxID=105785 RepID=UPI000CD7AB0B|nr:uncharacterized protein LOC111870627 [Cryptotermes secundus]
MLGRIVLPIVRKSLSYNEAAVAHVRAYHPPAHYKPPTMDDLPVPQGSWQTQHDSNQTKYNIHLIGGVTLLTFTLGFVAKSGIIDFNTSPPTLTNEEISQM